MITDSSKEETCICDSGDSTVNGPLNQGYSAGQTSINATLFFGNLNDAIVTDASGNKAERVNGSIGFTQTPIFGLSVQGTLNITTVTPIYTLFGSLHRRQHSPARSLRLPAGLFFPIGRRI